MAEIKLVAKDGTLYFPDSVICAYGDPGPILLYVYPEGDCDTVEWPRPSIKVLDGALFSAREQGLINHDDIIVLPNGKQHSGF